MTIEYLSLYILGGNGAKGTDGKDGDPGPAGAPGTKGDKGDKGKMQPQKYFVFVTRRFGVISYF